MHMYILGDICEQLDIEVLKDKKWCTTNMSNISAYTVNTVKIEGANIWQKKQYQYASLSLVLEYHRTQLAIATRVVSCCIFITSTLKTGLSLGPSI